MNPRLRPAVLALLLLVGGWLVAGVVTAGPASAHASLLRTDPSPQTTTKASPSAVHLFFSEPITAVGVTDTELD